MTSNQPRRSDLTSDLNLLAKIKYVLKLFGVFWHFLGQMAERKKEERKKTTRLY